MSHAFTRAELYAMVWAEPIRTIAARLGVSDVGLTKACKRSDIPTPERGYWAKLAHGKKVRQPPLPKRPDLPERVVVAPQAPKPQQPAAAKAVLETTKAPELAVPDDLRGAHPAVRQWAEDNAQRWKDYRRNGWGVYGLVDLKLPLQQRRLRLYSALFKGLAKAGLTVEPAGDPEGWSQVVEGGEKVEFRIYLRQTQSRRPLTAEERKDPWLRDRGSVFERAEAGDLILKINSWTGAGLPTEFREAKTPLDEQLGQVVVTLKAWLAYEIEREQERQADRRRREEAEALRARRAAYTRAQEERREKLLGEAKRWRRAAEIRAMVAAAEAGPQASSEGFSAWRDWALAEAKALDPVASGGLNLTLLEPFDPDADGSRTFSA